MCPATWDTTAMGNTVMFAIIFTGVSSLFLSASK